MPASTLKLGMQVEGPCKPTGDVISSLRSQTPSCSWQPMCGKCLAGFRFYSLQGDENTSISSVRTESSVMPTGQQLNLGKLEQLE